MRLEYPMTKEGLYILKRDDFDPIATMVLNEYQPAVLKEPCPLDINDLAGECLYLDMRSERLSYDGKTLGLIAFADTVYQGVGPHNEVVDIPLTEGTVLLDLSLEDVRRPGRKRFTQTHEASHWILHRSHHSRNHQRYEFLLSEQCPAIACRSDLDHVGRHPYGHWTSVDWEEWQANNLAAALLMPKDTMRTVFMEMMRKHGESTDVLDWKKDPDKSVAIVDDVKHVFTVSRRAAEVRLDRLGLLCGLE